MTRGSRAARQEARPSPGPAWTEEHVRELFVHALADSSRVSLYTAGRGFEPAGRHAAGVALILSWAERWLSIDHRQALYLWAMNEGRRRRKAPRTSNREFLQMMGWGSEATLYRHRVKACREIAGRLNASDIPVFAPPLVAVPPRRPS